MVTEAIDDSELDPQRWYGDLETELRRHQSRGRGFVYVVSL